MFASTLTHDAGSLLLAALPMGGLIAQVTDSLPSGWKDLGVAGCALTATVTLWLYLKQKDKDQLAMIREAHDSAMKAKEGEIARLVADVEYLRNELEKLRP